jgi:hypothetical protein
MGAYRCPSCQTDGAINEMGRFVSNDWLRCQTLKQEIDTLRNALELARNGIQWYIDNSPEANGCDDEALQQIDEALAHKRS